MHNAPEHLLLAEARHRTANAFQIVGAVLARGSRATTDVTARGVLQTASRQLRSFAMLDERLYGSRESACPAQGTACLAAHLTQLCAELERACLTPLGIGLKMIAGEPLMRSEMECRYLGLVTTELVLNAAKHAFPGRDDGEVRVMVGRGADGGRVLMIVADNGVGFGEVKVDAGRGLGFVRRLADVIDASIEATTGESGSAFTTTLPDNAAESRSSTVAEQAIP